MAQSEETIRRRIDALGLTEPFVAPYGQGDNEIIVELPGEGDPNRAKSVIQAGGQLELHRVEDANPYPSETAALAAHGGVLAAEHANWCRRRTRTPPGKASVYLLDRAAHHYRPGPAQRHGAAEHRQSRLLRSIVHAFDRGGAPLRSLHRAERRPADGIVLDHKVESAPVIQSRIDDQGRITGRFGQQEANDLALVLRAGRPASFHPISRRAHCRTVTGCRFDPPRHAGVDRQPAGGADFHGGLLPAVRRQRGDGACC